MRAIARMEKRSLRRAYGASRSGEMRVRSGRGVLVWKRAGQKLLGIDAKERVARRWRSSRSDSIRGRSGTRGICCHFLSRRLMELAKCRLKPAWKRPCSGRETREAEVTVAASVMNSSAAWWRALRCRPISSERASLLCKVDEANFREKYPTLPFSSFPQVQRNHCAEHRARRLAQAPH